MLATLVFAVVALVVDGAKATVDPGVVSRRGFFGKKLNPSIGNFINTEIESATVYSFRLFGELRKYEEVANLNLGNENVVYFQLRERPAQAHSIIVFNLVGTALKITSQVFGDGSTVLIVCRLERCLDVGLIAANAVDPVSNGDGNINAYVHEHTVFPQRDIAVDVIVDFYMYGMDAAYHPDDYNSSQYCGAWEQELF